MSKVQTNNIKERLIFISPIVLSNQERELCTNDFELLNPLGQGAFGKVYKVKNKLNNKIYALKQIQKKQIVKQQMVPQITNEIQLMYTIDHPNIIKIFNHFEENEFIYLELEFAGGGQLWHKLNKAGRFDEQTVKYYMKDIVNAVEYLHSKTPPIIHRDIKPENLLLDGQGNVKLADFGWSNVFNDNTKRKTYCGTLDYLAPEMIQELGHDVHLDIWSLGVLIFELLTGKAPFAPNDPSIKDEKQKQKILEQNILKVKIDYPSDFPILCKDLVNRLLKKDPNQRISIKDIKQHPWFNQKNNVSIFQPVVVSQQQVNINQLKIDSSQIKEFTNNQVTDIVNRFSKNNQETNNQNEEIQQQKKQQQNQNLNDAVQQQDDNSKHQNGKVNNYNNNNQINGDQGSDDDEPIIIETQSTQNSDQNDGYSNNINNNNNTNNLQSSNDPKQRIINDLNNKLMNYKNEISQLKVELEVQKTQNQELQKYIQTYCKQDDNQSKIESRKFKLLEDDKVKMKKDYDDLWEQLKVSETQLQSQTIQLEQLKDLKKQLEREKNDKHLLQEKIQKLNKQIETSEEQYLDLRSQKDQEVFKLELKLKELSINGVNRSSESLISGSQIGVRDLANSVDEIKNIFLQYQKNQEEMEQLQTQNQELEREVLKLKSEKDNEINSIKMQVQEQYEDDVDRFKQQFQLEKYELENKFEAKLKDQEKQIEQIRQEQIKNTQKDSEYESFKKQQESLKIQNNDMNTEWHLNKKLRQSLEQKIKDQELLIKDLEDNLKKFNKKK